MFVAAVGHPFGPNPDRGVFFTPTAAQTWQKTLYTTTRHGASDLGSDPVESRCDVRRHVAVRPQALAL